MSYTAIYCTGTIRAEQGSQQDSTLAHTIRVADLAGACEGGQTPLGGRSDEIKFPVNAQDVHDISQGVEPVIDDKCLVLYHVILQQDPELWDGKLVVRIQLLQQPLPRHEHRF